MHGRFGQSQRRTVLQVEKMAHMAGMYLRKQHGQLRKQLMKGS